ncbi:MULTISPECIES: hypothetical protein [Blautia]|uniref:hypothetical protein n=1 Tax=Blautia TaxID=572511 RepID=UPI000BA4CC9C|nr:MULTISPECIES: hypothetical protein [Blautia]
MEEIRNITDQGLIPVHWAGFVLSRHAWDDPAEQLTTIAADPEVSVATLRIGEIVNFTDMYHYQEKWRREIL